MWRRLTQWIGRLWSNRSEPRFDDPRRTKLMGLYLDQTNQRTRTPGGTDHYQERQDGKFAQRRGRD